MVILNGESLLGTNKKKLMRKYPGQPWMWREDWSSGRLESNIKGKMFAAIFGALFWNVISWVCTFAAFSNAEEIGSKGILLAVLLFPAIGIVLAAGAIYYVLVRLKFGKSVFAMAYVPGVVGGSISGVVQTSVNIIPEDGFRLALRCFRRTVTYSISNGKRRSNVSEVVLWEDSRVMEREVLESDLTQSHIPVLFAIPYEAEPTCHEDPSNSIVWRLEATAKVPGADYSATFEVPVFKTPESSPDFVLDEAPLDAYIAKMDASAELRAADIGVEPMPCGGTRFIFPVDSVLKGALITTFIFLFLFIATIGLVMFGGPCIVMIFLFVFDVFLFIAVVDFWTKPCTIEASPHMIVLTGSLIFSHRRKELEPKFITDIVPSAGMSSGSKHYFRIQFILERGKKVIAGGGILGRHMTQKLADEIKIAISTKTDSA